MGEPSSQSRATWVIPVAIFALAAALYTLLSSLTELPIVTPDEFIYGGIARSVGSGDGFTWYGVDQARSLNPLYVYFLAPSWVLASGVSAYEIAKASGAIAACAVVFPVWALARQLMPASPATVPAVLAVSGTWMISAGGLLSENLAFPLATAALVSTVLTLREPGRRWIWVALGFAALATLSRSQMVVIFPIILTALALDAALAEDAKTRIEPHRIPAALLGVLVLAGLIAFLSGSSSVFGAYSDIAGFDPSLGDILKETGDQWIALTIACGVLPLAALLAIGAQRSAWRDRDLGPLLCVTTPTVVLLLLESGYFNAGAEASGVERYVQYAIPMLLVLLFASLHLRRLPAVNLGAAGAAIGLTLLATPDIRQAFETRARFATSDVLGLDPWLALPLVALLLAGAGALLISRVRPVRVVYAIGALLFAVLALQSQSIWRWQVDLTKQIRAQYPESMTWVNDNAGGPVSRMYLFQNSALFQVADFFNDDVDQVLGPSAEVPGRPPVGPLCSWTASGRGEVQPSDGCRPMRRRVWNDDPIVSMSFHGGEFLARDPMLGQLIAVPENPRLRSMIQNPCQRATLLLDDEGSPKGIPKNLPCTPTMAINLWLDAPATLTLRYRGGIRPQQIRLGDKTWTLAARRDTTIEIPLNEPAPRLAFSLDWTARQGTPKLVDAAVVTDGRREPLL